MTDRPLIKVGSWKLESYNDGKLWRAEVHLVEAVWLAGSGVRACAKRTPATTRRRAAADMVRWCNFAGVEVPGGLLAASLPPIDT